ncbi:MAG: ribonuclease P protein component [Nevskiales bacterium]
MPDAQFPACVRLRQAAQFKAVFGAGQRHNDASFTVIYLPQKKSQARLGMVVSKKVSRLAVQRNRIKRQIRESFRQHRHTLPNGDLVVMARYRAAQQDNRALSQSLQRHWQRLARL